MDLMNNKVVSLRSRSNRLLQSIQRFSSSGSSAIQSLDPANQKASFFIEIAFIAGLIVYTISLLAKCLVTPWYYTSDEVVYTAEIVKFLDLNFNQNFFDIPGTPFMFLTTILWAVWYGLLYITGHASTAVGTRLFTFQHLQDLYFLMRLLVLIFYASSIALTYICGKRLTNAVGGCVAALFLALFFPYASYSSFVRTESMGITLALTALYLVLEALTFGKVKYFLIAGILSGVAAAARFHFALATLPVIISLYFFTRRQCGKPVQESTPGSVNNEKTNSVSDEVVGNRPLWSLILSSLIGAFFVTGGVITLLISLHLVQPNFLTHAMLITVESNSVDEVIKGLTLMRKLWLFLAMVSLAFFIALRIPKLRDRVRKILNPAIILIVSGFGVGFVLGTPTFLWRGSHLLRSIQFYGDWIDQKRQKLSLLGQLFDVYSSYWKVITPTIGLTWLLIVGAVLIILRRDRTLYPILIGCAMAFISQPILLVIAPYRVDPWLPYLTIVQAYPLAVVYQMLAQLNRQKLLFQLFSLSMMILIGTSVVHNGVQVASNNIEQMLIPRLNAVAQVTNWLEANTDSNAEIFLSYFSFNKAMFYTWIEQQGAKVPKKIRETRHYYPWWSNRSALQNHAGYLVATQADLVSKNYWDSKQPGEGVDPFTEKAFTRVASFAGGGYQFGIFRFDSKPSQPD